MPRGVSTRQEFRQSRSPEAAGTNQPEATPSPSVEPAVNAEGSFFFDKADIPAKAVSSKVLSLPADLAYLALEARYARFGKSFSRQGQARSKKNADGSYVIEVIAKDRIGGTGDTHYWVRIPETIDLLSGE